MEGGRGITGAIVSVQHNLRSEQLKKESVNTDLAFSGNRNLLAAVAGLRGNIKFNASLRDLTSLRIGGPADVLVAPKDVQDLCQLVKQARSAHVPIFVLGGTNLLIREGGLRGIVVYLSKLNMIKKEGTQVLYAEAGVRMPTLLSYAIGSSLAGLEWAAGIPGTVGGAVIMNAGTHLGEIRDCLQAIRMVDLKGQLVNCSASSISFTYRQGGVPEGIVVGAWFYLAAAPKLKIESKMKSYLRYRKATQPLARPNAGSVFKNPSHTSAGKLIEECGLKGARIGDAQVSHKHANFIINIGQARATDVVVLIKKIQQTVFQQTGVTLELEWKVVGDS